MLTVIGAGVLAVVVGLSVFKGTYEEPAYQVLQSQDNIELRDYAPMIVAEVTKTDPNGQDMGRSMNAAFPVLADYIFGNNIPMTAPVYGTAADAGYTTSFVMPKDATLSTLPAPTDARVTLRTLQGRKMLAIKYSWFMGPEKVQEGANALLAYAAQNNLEVISNPVAAYYDNPYSTLPWQRRNEVLVEVAAKDQQNP